MIIEASNFDSLRDQLLNLAAEFLTDGITVQELLWVSHGGIGDGLSVVGVPVDVPSVANAAEYYTLSVAAVSDLIRWKWAPDAKATLCPFGNVT